VSRSDLGGKIPAPATGPTRSWAAQLRVSPTRPRRGRRLAHVAAISLTASIRVPPTERSLTMTADGDGFRPGESRPA
jgi:hypothetical protein